MPIFVHLFPTSDRTYRTYLSARQTCSMPTKVLLIYKCFFGSCIFSNPQNVGNVEVVDNVRVDVTEPLLRTFKVDMQIVL